MALGWLGTIIGISYLVLLDFICYALGARNSLWKAIPSIQGDGSRSAYTPLRTPQHMGRARVDTYFSMLTFLIFSADATIASKATGAMSWAFVTALKKNPQQSYVQLLNSIRDELAKKYTQKPQLSCSHPLG